MRFVPSCARACAWCHHVRSGICHQSDQGSPSPRALCRRDDSTWSMTRRAIRTLQDANQKSPSEVARLFHRTLQDAKEPNFTFVHGLRPACELIAAVLTVSCSCSHLCLLPPSSPPPPSPPPPSPPPPSPPPSPPPPHRHRRHRHRRRRRSSAKSKLTCSRIDLLITSWSHNSAKVCAPIVGRQIRKCVSGMIWVRFMTCANGVHVLTLVYQVSKNVVRCNALRHPVDSKHNFLVYRSRSVQSVACYSKVHARIDQIGAGNRHRRGGIVVP